MSAVIPLHEVQTYINLARTDANILHRDHPNIVDRATASINELLNKNTFDDQTLGGDADVLLLHTVRLLLDSSRGSDPSHAELVRFALVDSVSPKLDAYLKLHSATVTFRGDTPNDDLLRSLTGFLLRSSGRGGVVKGEQLMETCYGNVMSAVVCISHVLEESVNEVCQKLGLEGSEEESSETQSAVVAVSRTLLDLSTPAAYFTEEDDTADKAMSDIQLSFEKNLMTVIHCIVSSPLLDYVTYVLDIWFQRLQSMEGKTGFEERAARTKRNIDCVLGNTLSFILNLLSYTHEYSVKLRRHIATNTLLVQNISVPYVEFLIRSVLRDGTAPALQAEANNGSYITVRCALHIARIVCFITYKIKAFRGWAQQQALDETFLPLLECKGIWNSPFRVEAVAVLVRLLVNCNHVRGVPKIKNAHSNLSVAERGHLSRRLSSPVEELYPVDASCETYRQLEFVFEGPSQEELDRVVDDSNPLGRLSTPTTTENNNNNNGGFNFSFADNLTGQAPFLIGGAWKSALVSGAGGGGGNDDDDDEVSKTVTSGVSPSSRRKIKKIRAYNSKAHKERERAKMRQRYAALKSSNNDSTKVAVTSGDCPMFDEEDETVAVCDTKNVAEHLEKRKAEAVTAPPPPPPPSVPPATMTTTTSTNNNNNNNNENEEEEQAQIDWDELMRATPPSGIPARYICALSHQQLVVPVITPNGDVFEHKVLAQYMASHQSRCPITKETLRLEDLMIDRELKKELELFKLRQQLRAAKK
eukprot:PhM_4_TR18692/c0_g1_i1/m.19160